MKRRPRHGARPQARPRSSRPRRAMAQRRRTRQGHLVHHRMARTVAASCASRQAHHSSPVVTFFASRRCRCGGRDCASSITVTAGVDDETARRAYHPPRSLRRQPSTLIASRKPSACPASGCPRRSDHGARAAETPPVAGSRARTALADDRRSALAERAPRTGFTSRIGVPSIASRHEPAPADHRPRESRPDHPDRIRSVGGARAEHALHRTRRIVARMNRENVSPRPVEPGQKEDVVTGLQSIERGAHRGREDEPRMRRALVALTRSVLERGQRGLHMAYRHHVE